MYSSEALSERYLHINSCGRQLIDKTDTHTLRENGRVDYHVLYILSGACHAVIDGVEYCVTKGSVAMFLPMQRQEYRFFSDDKSESVWIHFTGVGCEDYLKELELYGLPTFEVGIDAELMYAVTAMIRAKAMKNSESDKISDGYLYLVLSLMSRNRKYGKEGLKRFSEISKVTAYMDDNYRVSLPISQYASMCHLSKSRFEHVFKEYTGKTPLEYLFNVRMEEAMRLLENTDLPISRVAEEVGFDEPNYFTRLFKKYSGTSPLKYRKCKFEGEIQ